MPVSVFDPSVKIIGLVVMESVVSSGKNTKLVVCEI